MAHKTIALATELREPCPRRPCVNLKWIANFVGIAVSVTPELVRKGEKQIVSDDGISPMAQWGHLEIRRWVCAREGCSGN